MTVAVVLPATTMFGVDQLSYSKEHVAMLAADEVLYKQSGGLLLRFTYCFPEIVLDSITTKVIDGGLLDTVQVTQLILCEWCGLLIHQSCR